jgi:hypothetical protein
MPSSTKHITNKAPLTSAAMKLLDANQLRSGYAIQNVGSYDVYIGGSDVIASATEGLGHILKGGQTPPDAYVDTADGGAVYAIATGGTAALVVIEYY